ncbi:MAG: ATP-binding cassette domain-containing protein [Thermomicrobiales bacterium]|nr:ATP-binding cassette domain-containing protein [Thermomicrobiales bacterium]MCO5227716.1 ATP-binding cassette domain-containing protein [Thermomicrobiales bacterium]
MGYSGEFAVRATGLKKSYGETQALKGVDIHVKTGTVLGVLGPNGAGKTTAVRILTTLLKPDAGTAEVAGVDVLAHPEQARRVIGLSGQYAAVDEILTGRENLVMFGQLYGLPKSIARERATELLAQFGLTAAGDRILKTYSGGMRRRLDLAASLIVAPPVLVLDEPTTGLDPRSRADMWQVIENLVSDGTTVLLTTQYLEEADRLANEIVVIDHGLVIAKGTADELKTQLGGERLDISVADGSNLAEVEQSLQQLASTWGIAGNEVLVEPHTRRFTVPYPAGAAGLMQAVRDLDSVGIHPTDFSLRRPTLDDVFLQLTGHAAEDMEGDGSYE